MIRYIKSTYRYFKNNAVFVSLNLVGLIIGIGVFFFAYQYVSFELSYDTHNEHFDKIYRLVTDLESARATEYESTSAPMAAVVKESFPEVEECTRVFLDYILITNEEKDQITQENIAYVDPSLFSVFTIPLISGNSQTALDKPFSLVLSETAARKFFGTTDCLGKTLIIDGTYTSTVTAVMKDMPYNAHFRTDILLSMSSLLEVWAPHIATRWNKFGFYTYLILKEGTSPDMFNGKIRDLLKDHMESDKISYYLQAEPLDGLYFSAKARGGRYGSAVVGNINNVYIFSAVAILVLAIACFNFINLTIALSMKRAREIGVRKVLGATKGQLIFQFVSDALVISVIAFIAVSLLSAVLHPHYNQLAGKPVSQSMIDAPFLAFILFLICLGSGLISVMYSSYYLIRVQPLDTLKGKYLAGGSGNKVKNVLVVLQFAVSIALMVSTLVMLSQLDYMQNYDLGFEKDQQLIVDFHFDKEVREHTDVLKREFAAIDGVQSAAFSSDIPGGAYSEIPVVIENSRREPQEVQVITYSIDYAFLEQYGLELLAGRNFSEAFSTDFRQAVILNETAVRELGYNSMQGVIGKEVVIGTTKASVIGVIKDFHFSSLHERVRPLCIRHIPGWFTFATFNISPVRQGTTISALERKWKELIPQKPFIYTFFDQRFNNQYQSEQRFSKLFLILAGVTITISCLGLLGLAAFSMEQRTREIGIRKVLGASVHGMVFTLARDFLLLVGIAFVIGAPVAWYGMSKWLEGFAYKQGMVWSDFFISGMLAVMIAVITISFHTIKSSLVNPAKVLKDE